jgi:hypothetical protein
MKEGGRKGRREGGREEGGRDRRERYRARDKREKDRVGFTPEISGWFTMQNSIKVMYCINLYYHLNRHRRNTCQIKEHFMMR